MEEIAQVYARSLFEVAQERGLLDELRDELAEFADALSDNRQMAIFFFSPYFSTEEKKDGLRRAVRGANPYFMNFLETLIERHRMPVIFRIRTQYQALWDDVHQLLPVQITSAVPLGQDTVESVGARIGKQTGKQITMSSTVDPEILGGIVLRVGNFILDASIRSRLDQLRRQVAQA
jgi:F-type H+-transporting ATPase subunit delta